MPGKIVHTNEILVLLGDNWCVEKSAKQACELIDRRMSNIDHHLDELNQEKNKVCERLEWRKNLIEVTRNKMKQSREKLKNKTHLNKGKKRICEY